MIRVLLLLYSVPLLACCFQTLSARWWFTGEIAATVSLHASLLILPALLYWRKSRMMSGTLLVAMIVGALPALRAAWEPHAPLPERNAATVTAACANLYLYNEPSIRPQAVAAVLATKPQIVVLAESISSSDRPLVPLTDYPSQLWQPQINRRYQDCVALLTIYPIVNHRILNLNTQPAIAATLDVNGRTLHVIAVHTTSPWTTARLSQRNEEFDDLAHVVNELGADGSPVLLLGDCNLTVTSPMWHDFQVATDLRRQAGPEPASWPSWLGPLGITVDHLIGRNLALGEQTAFVIPGSDHRGLRGTLSW